MLIIFSSKTMQKWSLAKAKIGKNFPFDFWNNGIVRSADIYEVRASVTFGGKYVNMA